MPGKRYEQYQCFQSMLSRLLNYAAIMGIVVKGMEWYRTPERAAQLAKAGTGIARSKHCLSLAVDMYIVTDSGKDIVWGKRGTPGEEKYRTLAIFWEGMGGKAGFYFKTLYDPYHFELKENPA